LQNTSANGKRAPVLSEMCQNLLTNNEPRKKILCAHYPANLVKHSPEEICLFQWKTGEAPKKLKTAAALFCTFF
jgi:hypothetical protein